MSKILRFEDAVDIITSVLVSAVKIRIQAGKFGFEQIFIGTTTNSAEIRKYTEQLLVELLFEVAIEKIAKTGAGCVGIGLQKAWEEAFSGTSSRDILRLLTPCRPLEDHTTDLPCRKRLQQLGLLKWSGSGQATRTSAGTVFGGRTCLTCRVLV
jgi:hypothetical protein